MFEKPGTLDTVFDWVCQRQLPNQNKV